MGWFSNWINLEEIDNEDIKVRLFAQSLAGEVRELFTDLLDNSIMNYQAFEDSFKNKWEEKKNPMNCLSQFHSMKRRVSESFQEFSGRFLKVYNDIPAQFKDPPGDA